MERKQSPCSESLKNFFVIAWFVIVFFSKTVQNYNFLFELQMSAIQVGAFLLQGFSNMKRKKRKQGRKRSRNKAQQRGTTTPIEQGIQHHCCSVIAWRRAATVNS